MKKLLLFFLPFFLNGCAGIDSFVSKTNCLTEARGEMDKWESNVGADGIQALYEIKKTRMLKDKSGLQYHSWLIEIDIYLGGQKRDFKLYCVHSKKSGFVTSHYTEFTQEVALRRVAVIDSISQLFM